MDENTFDIFEFLKMSHREDVLHTPMIAGLLNPLGLHGLGDLFLRRFLDCLSCPELSLTRADPSDYDWVVKREHLVPGGRIDILLLCPKKRIAIAIENKIRARESRTQLPCYLTWLRSLSPYYTTIGLCLLSLKGTASATLPKHECTSISYTAILRCLLESLEERPRIPVGSYIRSYAKTFANLCGEEQPKWVAVREPVKESCNVFRFLYISRREDALHTPMLAGLLDPKSSHNQGSTFLSSFLKLLACSPTLPTTERKKLLEGIGCEWEVELERKVRTGRLDIFLCCRDKGILIVVENKLDAGEGQNQLYRYNEAISTRRAEFPHQILVLLTISGSPATSAGDALVHLLSYKQILTLVSEHCDKLNPGPMKDMVDAYLTVLEGIMLQPGTASRAGGRSKIPCPDHSKAALNFLDRFIAEWPRLPGSTKYLIPVSDPDKTHKGKYQGIWVWPKDLRQFQNQQLLIIRIATPLGNESMMGLYVGLRWRNTEWSNKNEKWVQLPEARDLLGLSNNIYRGPNRGMQNGQWFAICERLEYPRTDGALASALRFHERELHQLTASKIHNIWALCGDRVLALNKKLLSCQRA